MIWLTISLFSFTLLKLKIFLYHVGFDFPCVWTILEKTIRKGKVEREIS